MAIESTTVEQTKEQMKRLLGQIIPPFEIAYKAELVYEINRIKKEKGAIILGHNYMEPALFHTVPDVVGDSLQLSRAAAKAKADPIVFCGVRFMAETAKILNPARTVLIPAQKAGCSLAESITADDIRELRRRYPGIPIVAYINTYAEVKAEVDIICTSGNAAEVVRSLPNDTIIFVPDEYMAKSIARETGKRIIVAAPKPSEAPPEANGAPLMIGWTGRCEVHDRFTLEDVQNIRRQFPDVMVLAHPECRPEVVAASDFTGGTTAMVDAVKKTKASRYLLLTECSMADNIVAENPDKEMVRLCSIRCPHMNEITLEDTLAALRFNRYEVDVPEPTRTRALASIERMLAIH